MKSTTIENQEFESQKDFTLNQKKEIVTQYYFLNLICNIFLPGLGHLFITEEYVKGICFMGLFININIVIACLISTAFSIFSFILIPINLIIWAGVIADGQKIFELKIFHCKN